MVRAAKRQAGSDDRITAMYEPFPPTLNSCREYERGSDLVILKNEEDPQANIMMAMGRGAGRTFGKPFGFYWEQTHYPFPSLDEKLHVCMLYYLSGGSWISAELDEAPSFAGDVVAEWVYPLVQAMRFAMVHPARGRPIVPVGIVYGGEDAWWIPYNPFGQMDTFQRYIGYDHATGKLTCEPSFTKVFPWMPQEGAQWEWRRFGHLDLFHDKLDELRGYDLLDVFFPNYGDAYTAHITRLLTGTPYGPVDFVQLERATAEHLRTFGVLAVLGKAAVRLETEDKLSEAARSGAHVIVAAQDFPTWQGSVSGKPFGLAFPKGSRGSAGPGHGHAGGLRRQDRELCGPRVQRPRRWLGDGGFHRPPAADSAQASGQRDGLRVPGPLGVAGGRCACAACWPMRGGRLPRWSLTSPTINLNTLPTGRAVGPGWHCSTMGTS